MQQEVPAKMKVAELHQLNVGRKEFDPLQAEVPNLPEKNDEYEHMWLQRNWLRKKSSWNWGNMSSSISSSRTVEMIY